MCCYIFPRQAPVSITAEQLIIGCLHVPDVGNDRQANGLLVQIFRRCRTTYAAAILATGVPGNRFFPSERTAWVERSHALRKLGNEALVQFRSPIGLPKAPPLANFLVGQAFGLGPSERFLFDQQALPFITFSSSAEF